MVPKSDPNTLERAKAAFSSLGITVLVNEPMLRHTTFRIGGPADLFCIVHTAEQLINAVRLCHEYEEPLFILGGGSNVLVSDRGIRGVTIKNCSKSLSINENLAAADSGWMMPAFSREVSVLGLSGAEFMQTIPGTIGGGIHQNARFRHPAGFGAYDGFLASRDMYIGDLIDSVTILSDNGQLLELSNADCQFAYEGFFRSGFQNTSDTIVSACLRLQPDDPDRIRERLTMYSSYRKRRSINADGKQITQPIDPFTGTRPKQPSGATAGCVFFNSPNPDDHPTGRMIDMCGLKGRRIGNAQISPEHANYIVNLGQACAAHVRALMELCRSEVWQKFGVELVEEIEFIGEW